MRCERLRRRDFFAMMLVGATTPFFSQIAQAAPPPMTREEFAKAVPRGFPKEKLLKLLGKPSQEQKAKDKGLTALTWSGRVFAPSSGRAEAVTVFIFDEYETVHSVQWADGTVAD